jgi:hypothetical protein
VVSPNGEKKDLERKGRSTLDGTRDTHDDLVARSRVSSCPSQNAVKLPAARRERGGAGSRDDCLTEKGGRKLGMCGSNLQLSPVHGRFV